MSTNTRTDFCHRESFHLLCKNALDLPIVSVVIPVKNNFDTIEACLKGIFSQRLQGKLEVIIVDSGSTDGTLDIIRKYPVILHQIKPEEFNHGDTRSLGVQLAKGEFVALIVADAVPKDESWLERMLEHFQDTLVMAVTGQQIAPPGNDINPLQRYRPINKPKIRRVYFEDMEAFMEFPPEKKANYCTVDNVTTMYRRSALLELPFPRVMFGEDMLWAREALKRGWAIIFDPEAQVYHYHVQTFIFTFQRSYIEQYYMWKNFNAVKFLRPLLRSLLSHAYWLGKESCSLKEKARWLWYNSKITIAELFGTKVAYLFSRFFDEAMTDQAFRLFCSKPPTPKRAKALYNNKRIF